MRHYILTGFVDEIDEGFVHQLEACKKLGLKWLEIRGINGKNVSEMTIEEAKATHLLLEKAQLHVSSIASPIGKISILDDFETHLELFKHVMEIAKIMDTQYIRIFSFYIPVGKHEIYKQDVLDRMKRLTECAEEKGIILLLENEKEIYGDHPVRILEIVDYVKSSHLQLIFDFANFIQSGIVPLHAYEMLKHHIVYFHIKDARFETKEVTPAGMGDGMIKAILNQANFSGFASIEPHLGDFKGIEKLELNKNVHSYETNGFEKFTIALNAFVKLMEEYK